MQCLVASAIGDGLSPKQLYEAASRMRYIEASEGQQLYSAGQPCNKLFLLLQGRVILSNKKTARDAVVDTAVEGVHCLLGVEAARARGNHKETASVEGVDTRLLVFPAHELSQFQRMLPGLMRDHFRQTLQSVALGSSPRRAEEWTVDGYRELLNSCHWTSFIRKCGEL